MSLPVTSLIIPSELTGESLLASGEGDGISSTVMAHDSTVAC